MEATEGFFFDTQDPKIAKNGPNDTGAGQLQKEVDDPAINYNIAIRQNRY